MGERPPSAQGSSRTAVTVPSGTEAALPSLFSCGVLSTTCQPPNPTGRSGLVIQASFQQW